MSKSSIIKKEILEILKDGQEHKAYEIKEYLRKKHFDFEVTEGIFSNSFRTLTLEGKLRNTDRGVYRINHDMDKEIVDRVVDNNNIVYKSNKDNESTKNEINKYLQNNKNEISKSEECLKLETEISKSINEMRVKITGLVNGINIMKADEETVSYILKVRHALEGIEKEIKYN